jgi:hypothetical protein
LQFEKKQPVSADFLSTLSGKRTSLLSRETGCLKKRKHGGDCSMEVRMKQIVKIGFENSRPAPDPLRLQSRGWLGRKYFVIKESVPEAPLLDKN